MKRLAVIFAAGLLLVLSGVALASIPDSSGVIHGCYKTGTPNRGSVIVIDTGAGQSCPSGYTPLNWSQTGPQGPAGPQGLAGTSYNFRVVDHGQVNINAGDSYIYEFNCPGLEGVQRPLSGGWLLGGDGVLVNARSWPVGDSNGFVNRWRFAGSNQGPGQAAIRFYLVCAEPTS